MYLYASSANNTVGGTTAAARNIISANTGAGVYLTGSGTTGNVVQGNYIGTDVSGTANLGNAYGVVLAAGASSNAVGGTATGAGNVIAYSSNDGVYVNTGTGNAIRENSIYDSGTSALHWSAAATTIRPPPR